MSIDSIELSHSRKHSKRSKDQVETEENTKKKKKCCKYLELVNLGNIPKSLKDQVEYTEENMKKI